MRFQECKSKTCLMKNEVMKEVKYAFALLKRRGKMRKMKMEGTKTIKQNNKNKTIKRKHCEAIKLLNRKDIKRVSNVLELKHTIRSYVIKYSI